MMLFLIITRARLERLITEAVNRAVQDIRDELKEQGGLVDDLVEQVAELPTKRSKKR